MMQGKYNTTGNEEKNRKYITQNTRAFPHEEQYITKIPVSVQHVENIQHKISEHVLYAQIYITKYQSASHNRKHITKTFRAPSTLGKI